MELGESAALAVGGAVLGTALSFTAQRVIAGISANSEAKASLLKRIADLERDNDLLKRDVVPLNLAVQKWAVEKLTHNHTPEMDELMTRIGPPNTLKPEEIDRLGVLLKERVVEFNDPQIDDVERIAASMLLQIIEWNIAAEKKPDLAPTIQVTSTPAAEEKTAEPATAEPATKKAEEGP